MRGSCGSGRLDRWHFSQVKVEKSRVKHVYVGRLVGPWSLVLSPGCRVLWFFLPVLFAAAFCGVRAKNEEETATYTHDQLVTPAALDNRVDPTSDPTSELVTYLCSLRPRQAA